MTTRRAVLGSTYRLQLNGLGFLQAAGIVSYLARLGIDTLYLSPIATARPESTSGYDVIDPNRLDPRLGGVEEFSRLLEAVDHHGLGLLVDIVPNHLALSLDNEFVLDLLRDGPKGSIFDVDWNRANGKIVLPVLDKPLAEAIERAELRLCKSGSLDAISYAGRSFPLRRGEIVEDADDVVRVLSRQHYRLAYWRVAGAEVNYRRFFDINDLIAVRVEDPQVFERTHCLVAELLARREVVGVRVDHIDGLFEPVRYLERLRSLAPRSLSPPVVLVEKITTRDDQTPTSWPIDGLTGYEFADLAGAVLTEESGARHLQALFRDDGPSFDERVRSAKRKVIDDLFSGAFDALAQDLFGALYGEIGANDLPVAHLRAALVALSVELPVYRSYLSQQLPISPADRRLLTGAARRAAAELSHNERRALEVILCLANGAPHDVVARKSRGILLAWQQLTSAVAAKGVEDTAFFSGATALSGTEVGFDVEAQAISPDEFHHHMLRRKRRAGLNATSTHDTKRSEDVRARLQVLAEYPVETERLFLKLHELNDPNRSLVERAPAPDRFEERYLYQSLIGTWPLGAAPTRTFRERIGAHMQKALREAKRHSSWLEPNIAYERAIERFLTRLLSGGENPSRELLTAFVTEIAPLGVSNSLAMVLLKATAPGFPDIYQGNEIFTFALTDPDNRRPVDFGQLARSLDRLEATSPGELLRAWQDGRIKQFVTRQVLRQRQGDRALFAKGTYVPIHASGTYAANALCFARCRAEEAIITVVARCARRIAGGQFPLGGAWGSTSIELPVKAKAVQDVLTGKTFAITNGRIYLRDVLAELPLCLLRTCSW